MPENQFTGFFKNPTLSGNEQTVFGVLPGGERIGFENMDQLASVGGTDQIQVDNTFNPGGDFKTFSQYQPADITPTSPVKLDVEEQLPATNLNQPATSTQEIYSRLATAQQQQEVRTQAFLDEMKTLRDQTLEATKPTDQELQVQQDINEITQQARELRSSFKAGVDQITGQQIPLSLAYGQTRELENQVNRRLEALSTQQAPLVDQLQTLQAAREVKLTQLDVLRDFASQNYQLLAQNSKEAQDFQLTMFQLAQEQERYQRQEQQAAQEFALETGITTPYYNAGGTIYRTSDGKAFSTPQEFFADAGVASFEQAEALGILESAQTASAKDTQIITANGRQLLVDKQTGEVLQDFGTAYKGGSSGGSASTENAPDSLTTGQVKEWIYENKLANSNLPWYDLWGDLAEELKRQGLNPENYDKQFWEILHPEGLSGYKKYIQNASSDSSNSTNNPFR